MTAVPGDARLTEDVEWLLYGILVVGGGYQGRLPWDRRDDDPLNYPCPACGAGRGERCSHAG